MRQYEVQYASGETEYLTTNMISYNMLSQVGKEGRRHMMMDEIIYHRRDDTSISKEQGTFMTSSGLLLKNSTTRGWEFCD